ncbi:CLUMA_CG012974, isoform A [Clunio marinus]|uniref:CLUMA_CG012974, isoform A n=1 Tax=Clunio marinus TaxID=568069 RepID=A0A1J1IHJ6_9DIPT|nr:CLUMA_CG012974, isoform A [Clunio marinus]
MFTNKDEQEMKNLHIKEIKKFKDNCLKLEILKRISIKDFPSDLSENSRKNIEKALQIIKIKDYINLGNEQKLLGLNELDLDKINLSYSDKKLIRERVEYYLDIERTKCEALAKKHHEIDEELQRNQDQFIEIAQENISMGQTLVELKNQEKDLLIKVAQEMSSPLQLKQVEIIHDEAKSLELQIKAWNVAIQKNELERTQSAKEAILEVSANIDELIKRKEEREAKKVK